MVGGKWVEPNECSVNRAKSGAYDAGVLHHRGLDNTPHDDTLLGMHEYSDTHDQIELGANAFRLLFFLPALQLHVSAAQSSAYRVAVKAVLIAQASAILRLLQEAREDVSLKTAYMVVTDPVFHV